MLVTNNSRTPRPKAVVLMSGGLDSCVATSIARIDYRLFALHASYGQRTETRERQAFEDQVRYFGIRDKLVIDLPHLSVIGGSSLTDAKIEVPTDQLDSGAIPNTYVPFRNAHMLSAAVSWAEVLGASRVFIGAVEEDSSGYPDCRPEYYEAMNRLIAVGTRPETHIRVETPLIDMRKSEIIARGTKLDAPLHLTWSCYRSDGAACGRCDSCALRLRAFGEAGLEDPILYEGQPQYAKIADGGSL
jgi:7-cyano-7-deazaguanine synthase